MNASARMIWQLTSFDTGRIIRDRMTWIGVVAFALLLSAGAWSYWHSLPPRDPGDRLFGYAYLTAALLTFHVGIARDRAVRFDECLISNFASPSVVYAAKVMAALVTLLFLAGICLAVALVASAGDFRYAAWYVVL